MLARAGRWEELEDIYTIGVERAPNPAVGRELALKVGLLLLEECRAPERAAPWLRRVLATDPDDIEALHGLHRVALRAGRFEEAADLLDRAARTATDDDRAEILVELAVIARDALILPDRALHALRLAFEAAPLRTDVLERAAGIFISEGRFHDAKEVLDDLGRLIADGATSDEIIGSASDAERRLAEAYRRLGVELLDVAVEHEIAEQCLERARDLGDEEALAGLDELAQIKKDWESRAQTLRDTGFEARDKRRAAELYLSAAQLYVQYDSDALRSDEVLDRCLILIPGFKPAIRFLETLYLREGRHEDLRRRLTGMVATVKDLDLKLDLLLRVAQLEEGSVLAPDKEPEPQEAESIINAYRRVLAQAPEHREAVERVSSLLSDLGRHADRVQLLEAHLAALSDDYAKVQVHLELGRVYAELLGDNARARNHFEAVLGLVPQHFEAASALRALYKDAREDLLLLGVLDVLVGYAPDRATRLDVLAEMAEVASRVGREETFSVLERIFVLDPKANDVAERLARSAEELSSEDALADVYQRVADLSHPREAVGLYLKAARLYDLKLPRPKDAVLAYKAVLALDPNHPIAQEGLERLLREQNDPEALVQVLRAQKSRTSDPAEARLLSAKLGDVLDHELSDPTGATEAFEDLLSKDPDSETALSRLDGLYRRTERWNDQARILALREVRAAGEADRLDFIRRRARLHAEHLDQPEEAARLYLEALALAPEGEVVTALRRLAKRGVSVVPIAAALEPIFAKRGEAREQYEMLQLRMEFDREPDVQRDATQRAAALCESRLADPETAFALWSSILVRWPGSEDAVLGVVRLAELLGEPLRARAPLQEALDGADRRPDQARLAAHLGELVDRHGEDRDEAIRFFRRALDADGSRTEAIAALERLLGAEARYGDLAELLEKRWEATAEPAASISLGLALASLKEEYLGDSVGAIEAYREVLKHDPREPVALVKLADALERAERWPELVRVLDRLREASVDPRRIADAEVRAGDVIRVHLQEPEKAKERYVRALEVEQDSGRALAGLEALMSEEPLRAEVGRILEEVYARLDRPADRVHALDAQLSGTTDESDRKALFRSIAELQADRLDQPEAAFETLSRAFREGLLRDAESEVLSSVAERSGRVRELAELYEDTLRERPDEVALLRALARLYAGAAMDPQRARRSWARIIEQSPHDEEALAALEELASAGDDPEELARVLARRADAATETAERVALLRRAAAVYEEAVRRPEAAIEALEIARRADPDDRAVLSDLARLYEAQQALGPLEATLAVDVNLVEAPLARAAAWVRLADVRTRRSDVRGAIEAYASALSVVPRHQEARHALEAFLDDAAAAPAAAAALEPVYREAGDWVRLAEVYDVLAATSDDPADRVEKLVAIRSLFEERIGEPDRAFDASVRAYAEAPERPELLKALERLGRRANRVDDMLAVLDARADGLPEDSPERAFLRLRVARHAEALLRDRGRAVLAYATLLSERPDSHDALEALDRLHAESGAHRERVDILRRRAGRASAPGERVAFLKEAARILDDRLGDRGQAAALYEEIAAEESGDITVLARLDELYAERREVTGLGRVLEARIRLSEGQQQADLLLRLGTLRGGPLQDPEGAIEAYGRVLDGGPELGPAYEAALTALEDLVEHLKPTAQQLAALAGSRLEPHFEALDRPVKLVRAKEAQVGGARDLETRKALLLQIADIYEQRLHQPEMAFLALTRAYGESPNDMMLARRLDALASIAETQEELAELYAHALVSVEEPEAQLELARKTAHLFDVVLSREDAAVPFYERMLSLCPDDGTALAALERIYQNTGELKALANVYRGRLRSAEDDQTRKLLYGRLAELADNDLRDPEAAFSAYRAMLELDPEDRAVLGRMAAVCERSGRFEDLSVVLVRQVDLTSSPDDKAQLLLRLATLQREQLNDRIGAVESYAQALAVRDRDPGAIAGLSTILREPKEGRAEAAEVLAPFYQAAGAYEDYVLCLSIRVDVATNRDERRALLEEIAETYESRLGRPEHALTYAERAFHEAPMDADPRSRLERLARQNDALEELAAFYLDELEGVTDAPVVLMLRRRVAEIYDERGNTARAIVHYGRVLDDSPGDPVALQALERLYRTEGSYEELADVYRRRIARSEDRDAKVALMRELARLQADALDDPPGAIATLRRLLELERGDVGALQGLSRLCENQSRWSEQADVLARLIEAAEPGSETRSRAQFDLARVRSKRLGDLAGADRLFAELFDADPTYAPAREFLQEQFGDAVAEQDLARAREGGRLLAGVFRRTEDWEALTAVLRMQGRLEPVSLKRVPLNREIAEVYEKRLNQPELAFTTLATVYCDAPGLSEVREGLESLADRLDLWEELVEVLQEGLPGLFDSDEQVQVERRMAQLIEDRLGDQERAAEVWRRVLSHRPQDEEGLEAIDRLSLSLGRWAAAADVLEKRYELADSDEARHAHAMRLGALWDGRLEEPVEALNWYRRAAEAQPDDRGTLEALARLLPPDTAADELHAVLDKLVAQEMGSAARVRYLARQAELAGGPLEDPDSAIVLWQKVLADAPARFDARQALESLYERTGRWTELAALLEGQLDTARDDAELMRLQRQLGLIKGTRLGSVEEAVRSWAEILKRNPNDVEALESLRQIYRQAGRWSDLVITLRKLIPLQTHFEGVKEIRFELAEVFLSKLEDREEAIESAKRVLDVEPHTISELTRLEEIFVTTGAYGEAVKVMSQRAELAENRGERIEMLFEVAKTYEERIHRRSGAASAYESILELEPDNSKAFDALQSIYEQNGDFPKLVELLNRRLDITEEAEARREFLFAIVNVQERWLGHPELAFTAACRAFAEEGADERAQELAERLADETSNWEILAEVYEEQIDQVGVSRAAALRKRLAAIYRDELGELEEAEEQLAVVLSIHVDDADAREQIVALYEGQGRFRDVVDQLRERVDLSSDPEQKKRLLARIARLQEEELDEADSAVDTLKRRLNLDPEDPEALDELARILRRTQKWHPLLNILERQMSMAVSADIRLSLSVEIAGVWDRGIEDADRAIEAYRDVLALDGGHRGALRALERLYTQTQRGGDLIEVYECQVEAAESEAEAITILEKVAAIWEEQFRDLSKAADTYVQILEIEPDYLPAVKSLERVWREEGDWVRLVEAYERHVELVNDESELVRLHLALGDVHLGELDDGDRAAESYAAALEIDPDSRPAVRALGNLYERRGDWSDALEVLNKEAVLSGADPEAVEVHHRIGRIQLEELADRSAAQSSFARAIELDPSHQPSLRALRKIHVEDGRPGEVISLLTQEAEHTTDLRGRAELYQQAADQVLGHFDDIGKARVLFEKSVEAVPDHVPSLRALADLYFSEEEWKKAEEILERLVGKLNRNTDQEELCRHYYRLAYIAEKLGQDASALRRYLASYEIDATFLPSLEGLAAALLRADRLEDAQRIFQTILIQHKASLTDAEIVDLYFQIGEIAARREKYERAQKSFAKALDLDPEHAPTLQAAARLAAHQERWEESYDLRERLISSLSGGARFEALVEQAKLCEEKIEEPYRAIDAYREALRERPGDVATLRSLVRLYRDTSQTPQTVETLRVLARALTDPLERRDVYEELADVHEREQKDAAQAVAALNRALDLDPARLVAFERIERILGNAGDWSGLEYNYHLMIKRTPKEHRKARLVLWRSVGDLYAKALKDDDRAQVAYEVVLNKLDPDAHEVAFDLAELYAKRRETGPKAIALYHRIFPKAPDPARPARRLFELYHALGKLDRAFCALGALVLMRAATDEEVRAYGLLLKKATQWPRESLTDVLWRTRVLHPACRGSLADILSILYRGAPEVFGEAQRALAIKKRERIDLSARGRNARGRLRYFDVFRRLSAAMRVGTIDHAHRAQSAEAPRLVPGAPPVLFAGCEHESFKTLPSQVIAWTLARQMAIARPELAPVQALMAPDEVGAVVEAAIRLYLPRGSGVPLDLDERRVQAWTKILQRSLSERALKALQAPVFTCIEKQDMKRLSRFLEGAEHSASRAALLMAQDVRAAERGTGDSDQLVDVSFRARVRALMLYTLTEDHFVLREKLGLAITA